MGFSYRPHVLFGAVVCAIIPAGTVGILRQPTVTGAPTVLNPPIGAPHSRAVFSFP
jgi:hypothetical protein